jgi:hypothetical protein
MKKGLLIISSVILLSGCASYEAGRGGADEVTVVTGDPVTGQSSVPVDSMANATSDPYFSSPPSSTAGGATIIGSDAGGGAGGGGGNARSRTLRPNSLR